jgi:hypothetical protein
MLPTERGNTMKILKASLCAFLLVALLSACGTGPKTENPIINDQQMFFDAYNKVAAEIGATQITADDLDARAENGEVKDGFSVRDGVMQANILSFTPGLVTLVGRPYDEDFIGFYLETEAVMMALTGLDKESADAEVEALYFDKDAAETLKPGGTSQASKTVEINGIKLSASRVSPGIGGDIFSVRFTPK